MREEILRVSGEPTTETLDKVEKQKLPERGQEIDVAENRGIGSQEKAKKKDSYYAYLCELKVSELPPSEAWVRLPLVKNQPPSNKTELFLADELQKAKEVVELKQRMSTLERRNEDLESQLQKRTKDFEGLYAALAYNFEEGGDYLTNFELGVGVVMSNAVEHRGRRPLLTRRPACHCWLVHVLVMVIRHKHA